MKTKPKPAVGRKKIPLATSVRDLARARTTAARSKRSPASDEWILRLYVAGQTPKSVTAFTHLKKICEDNLAGRYRIEVVDLTRNPELARGDQIVALPTLVRKLPAPIKRIIGDLSNIERVLVGMELNPAVHSPKSLPK